MSTKKCMRLEDFSNEILSLIASNLEEEDQLRFCVACPLAGRLLSEKFTAITLCGYTDDDGGHVEYYDLDLTSFTQALLIAPGLFPNVKAINIHIATNEEEEEKPPGRPWIHDVSPKKENRPWNTTILSKLLNTAGYRKLSQDENLIKSIARGRDEDIFPILFLLRGIERLKINLSDGGADSFHTMSKFLRLAQSTSELQVRNLTKVTYYGEENGIPVAIGELFALPSIRQFKFVDCSDDGELKGWTCPEGTSPIVDLKFKTCSLSTSVLESLIKSAKSLESLSAFLRDDFTGSRKDGFAAFGNPLQKHKESLMNLTIDIDAEYECGWAWSVPAIGSLKEFKKLYEVQTAGSVLFPEIKIKYPGNKRSPHPVSFYKDLLPSSLQRIIFTSMSPSTQAHILALGIFASDLKSDTCPELELVKLTTDEWATCEGPEDRDDEEEKFMYEGFKAASVRFKSSPYIRVGYDPWGDEAMEEYQSSA